MDAFTIDDADQLFADPTPTTPAEPPKLEDIPLPSGAAGDIPADNVAALAQQAKQLQDALRLSEAGRMAAMAQLQSQPAPVPVQPQQPQYTMQQLRDMMASGDPDQQLAAVAIIQQQSLASVESIYRHKIDSLQDGTVASAEAEARRKYPLEFELFGDEIMRRARELPDRSPLTNPDGWRHIISYVRGLDDNVERYASKRAERAARDAQAGNAGFSGAATTVRSAPSTPIVVDETTKQIALALGEDPVAYARLVQQWSQSSGPMTLS